MNLAWKIAVFTICLNIAGGIMTDYLGIQTFNTNSADILGSSDIYGVNTGGFSIDTQQVTGEVNWADNLLGLIGLGFIVDMVNWIIDYLFGITNILMALLPNDPSTNLDYLRYIINGLITIIYTFSLFSLFTGKKLNED